MRAIRSGPPARAERVDQPHGPARKVVAVGHGGRVLFMGGRGPTVHAVIHGRGVHLDMDEFIAAVEVLRRPEPTLLEEGAIEAGALEALSRFQLDRKVRLLGVRGEFVPLENLILIFEERGRSVPTQWLMAGVGSSVADFLALTQGEWVAALRAFLPVSLGINPSGMQESAWAEEFAIVREAFQRCVQINASAAEWSATFEYELPLEGGRRPDVVVLAGTTICVLEFKSASVAKYRGRRPGSRVCTRPRGLSRREPGSRSCCIPLF